MFLPKLRIPDASANVTENDKIPYITINRFPRSTENCKTSDLEKKQNRITSTIGLEEKETKNLAERNYKNVQMMQMQKQKLTGVEALLKGGERVKQLHNDRLHQLGMKSVHIAGTDKTAMM